MPQGTRGRMRAGGAQRRQNKGDHTTCRRLRKEGSRHRRLATTLINFNGCENQPHAQHSDGIKQRKRCGQILSGNQKSLTQLDANNRAPAELQGNEVAKRSACEKGGRKGAQGAAAFWRHNSRKAKRLRREFEKKNKPLFSACFVIARHFIQ